MSSEQDSVTLSPDEQQSAHKAREWQLRANAELGDVYLRWRQAKKQLEQLDGELAAAERAAYESRQQYLKIMHVVASNHSIEQGEWELEEDKLVRKGE